MRFLIKKISNPYIRQRIFRERLTEPLHLNFLSGVVALFGSYRQKIDYDLVLRPHNAYAIQVAAIRAKHAGHQRVTVIEFGVAAGAGLLNMAHIASRLSTIVGVEIDVVGFDTGSGMPPARDYRDHPDRYWQGSYPMTRDRLEGSLPKNTRLVLGDIAETASAFLARLTPDAPIGYVVLDVDYYWSSCKALGIFDGAPELYLPMTEVYVDDVNLEIHNRACGVSLAISEFNASHPLRPIERNEFLVHSRIFKNAMWLSQMYRLHVLDHPVRQKVVAKTWAVDLGNPYL